MRTLLADLRYAWHRARRQPGVALAVILLLALGMGGVTAVFNPIGGKRPARHRRFF